MSDNLSGAENQQERLIELGWVIGFVDGEGCFSIGFIKQPSKGKRSGFFGVGMVLANRRHDNHKEHLYRYVVRSRKDLLGVIIPFFRTHPMHSAKQQDFEKFARCVEMIEAGHHLTRDGLIDIAHIAETMNRCKSHRA